LCKKQEKIIENVEKEQLESLDICDGHFLASGSLHGLVQTSITGVDAILHQVVVTTHNSK